MSDLYLQLDEDQLRDITQIFANLSPVVIKLALHRAQRRTEATVRKQALNMMCNTLDLAPGARKRLAKRVQTYIKSSDDDVAEMRFWFGLNNLSPDMFRGGVKKTAGGLLIRGTYYERAFVAIVAGKKRVMQRVGKAAYPVQKLTIPISDEMTIALEDELFVRIPDIYLHHFETDMRGRATSDTWKRTWQAQNLAAAERNMTGF